MHPIFYHFSSPPFVFIQMTSFLQLENDGKLFALHPSRNSQRALRHSDSTPLWEVRKKKIPQLLQLLCNICDGRWE